MQPIAIIGKLRCKQALSLYSLLYRQDEMDARRRASEALHTGLIYNNAAHVP